MARHATLHRSTAVSRQVTDLRHVDGLNRPTVLLADDHSVVAAGLARLLEPEVDLVATVEDGRALLEATATLRPDVIVTDISMPLLNGLEATRRLKASDPDVKIVILTMHPEIGLAQEAFQAGACGYVLKQCAAEELLTAIREVYGGRAYLTPRVAKGLLQALARSAPEREATSRLTPRQREVLQLIAEGRTIKEVASILDLSARTIEFHRYKMMEELDLHSTAELTRYAIKHGLVALD